MNEDKATRYHRLRRRADLLGAAAAAAVLLTLVVSGLSVRLREAVAAVSGFVPGGMDDAVTVALLALLVVSLLQAVELPFAFYQGFILEHRYGLSTQTARLWFSDHLKGTVLSVAAVVGGASFVFLTLREWPRWWWLISAAVFAAATIVIVRVAPVLLLPWFYRCVPLNRPELVERLMAIARRARTDVVGVFEWVLSGHTRKANAALAGLGTSRRILLSDTLLTAYTDDEIEVILAHELAHHVHHDLWRGIGVHTVILTAGFYAADAALAGLAAPLGLRGVSDPAALPLLLLGAGGWTFVMLPVVNALSRARERAADRYALAATRNVDAFVTAMKRLGQQNMAEESPSAPVRWLFHSHPTIAERIAAARKFAAGRP